MLLNITVTVKPKNRFINLDIDIAFARDIARLTMFISQELVTNSFAVVHRHSLFYVETNISYISGQKVGDFNIPKEWEEFKRRLSIE